MAGQLHEGHAGLAWLTPPGVEHAERAVTAYSNYFIALTVEGGTAWPAFLEDDTDGSLGRVCQQIVAEHRRPSREQERLLELLAGQLECLLNRTAREQVLSHPAQVVANAARLMEERSGQALGIAEIAVELGVSASALRGYFQTVKSCSPRTHLQQVRLEKAVRFLCTSTLKLEAVAELCGYDSASHLTRQVRRFTGRTPGQVRRHAFRDLSQSPVISRLSS
jgi:transcriptional regulator GlxA family with amidase domain